jgi:uncharacterized membrane protein YccF (DUF307 family)
MYVVKLCLAMLWAIPWCLAAVVLGLTFVGLPIAFAFWIIGCLPYQRVVRKHQLKLYAERNKDRVLEQEGEVPWEM